MINAAVLGNNVCAVRNDGLGLSEKVIDLIGVMHVQIQKRAAGDRSVHIPVLPGIAVYSRRNALECGREHPARLAALEILPCRAVFRPCADAKPDIEKAFGLFRRLNDALHFRRRTAERFFAENVFSRGKSRTDEFGMVRRRHADIDHIHRRIGYELQSAPVDGDPCQIKRLGIVAAADVGDHRRDIPLALSQLDIGKRDDLRPAHRLVYAPMRGSHESETDDSYFYRRHDFCNSFQYC